MPFARVLVRRLLLPAGAFAVFAALAAHRDGFPERFDPQVAELERITMTLPNELRAGCHVPNALFDTPVDRNCRLGSADAPPDGILLGDSHANHFTGMLDELGRAQGFALIDYTMDACPPIPGYTIPGLPAYAEHCRARNESAFAHVMSTRYRHVFLAGQWPADEGTAGLLESAVKRIERTGARVIVILPTPHIPGAASCPLRARMYGVTRDCSAPQQALPAWWTGLRSRLPETVFLDPAPALCRHGRCTPLLDGQPAYRDDGHLNDAGSRRLARTIAPAL